jgi:hypothetical protein
MLFIVALVLMLPAGDGVAPAARAVAARAPEMGIPADMRDPVGLVPAKEAAAILRKWLEVGDWYVKTVAVIRLKELGHTLTPEELQLFFVAAALCDDEDLKLVHRALDALTTQEARDGVGLLLDANCEWAVPYAIRFDVPGTAAWLRGELRRVLGLDNRSPDTGDWAFHPSVYYPLKQLLALEGERCLPFLVQIAEAPLQRGGFDILLPQIESVSPQAALAVARRRPPTVKSQREESIRVLLKHGNGRDMVAALRHYGRRSHYLPHVRYLKGPPPAELVPMLVKMVGTAHRDNVPLLITLLARSDEPVATRACLAALTMGCTASILAKNNRADLRPKVLQLARERLRQKKSYYGLMPMVLLNAGPDVYDLVVTHALSYRPAEDVDKYLLRFPKRTAKLSLRWVQSDDWRARERGMRLLFDLGDVRAVSILLDRWKKRPETVKLPLPNYAYYGSEPDCPTWWLDTGELTDLARSVPPDLLLRAAHAIVNRRPWHLRHEVGRHDSDVGAAPPKSRDGGVRARIDAYIEACLARITPHWSGPPPYDEGPSPVRILQLREFAPAHVRPLVDSPDEGVRILAAHLLGGWERTPQEGARPILEHMLGDKSEHVRVAAFRGLSYSGRARAWYYDRLRAGKPDGPGLQIILDMGKLVPNETAILVEALTGKAMTESVAEDICERLLAREGDAYAPIEVALKQPLSDSVRAALVWKSGEFASVHSPYRSYSTEKRVASPAARRTILKALTDEQPKVRDAALAALQLVRIPESIPTLLALIKEGDDEQRWRVLDAARMQGPDPRLAAALKPLVTAPRPLAEVGWTDVSAYVCAAGRNALPELRALARGRAAGEQLGTSVSELVAEALVQFDDAETLPEQALWVRSSVRWYYGELVFRRNRRVVVSEPLRAEVVKLVKTELAKLAVPGKEPSGKELDLMEELARWAPAVGIPLLIDALERGRYGNRDAHRRLQSVLSYRFGDSYDDNRNSRRSYKECARQARRWWQLEGGRSLKALRKDALFP